MQPLLDGDVLLYELASCGEYKDEEGNLQIREFDFVAELLDGRIRGIVEDTGSDQEPIVFLTAKRSILSIANRSYAFGEDNPLVFVPPFREQWATIKPYKGTRKNEKPYHFDNLAAYIIGTYDYRISAGLEADDYMCIEQYSRRADSDTVICSRDKDLRMCPGWQFSWECGQQPSFGPVLVDGKGDIKLTPRGIKGVGLKFFFSQMLTGDTVDNIPGCPGVGPVKAFEILSQCETKREHEEAIIEAYKKIYPDNYKEMIEEQSKLLWMVRELKEDGSPIHYEWKY